MRKIFAPKQRSWLPLAFTMVAALHAGPTWAGPIAVVKVVQGDVQVLRKAQLQLLVVGSELEANDRILTGVDSGVGLSFRDGTVLSVGPSGELLVDRFEFDSSRGEGRFETTLAKGRMSVISGKIAKHQKDAMKVRTPSTTLGIRGTEFLVEANP